MGVVQTTTAPGRERVAYYLLEIHPAQNVATIKPYSTRAEFDEANREYMRLEQEIAKQDHADPGANAVLVSVDSIDRLPKAYPNYFLDTESFQSLLDSILSSTPQGQPETPTGTPQ